MIRNMAENSLSSSSSLGNTKSSATDSSSEFEPDSGNSTESIILPTIEELKNFRTNTDLIDEQYEILEKLGEGGFGAVFKAKCKLDKQLYALKVIPIDLEEEEVMKREIDILSRLYHDNIVRYHASFRLKSEDDFFDRENYYFCIRMQFCDKTLHQFMDSFLVTEESQRKQRINIVNEIFEGIQHIHDNGIIHRDLNPRNIFLTKEGNVKIGDFGSSRQAAIKCSEEGNGDVQIGNENLTNYIGTRMYCAPEIRTGKYDKSADLYSAGMILFEMFCFSPGTTEQEKAPVIQDVRSPEVILPGSFEPDMGHVVKGLLNHDPDHRMSFSDAQRHLKQIGQGLSIAPEPLMREMTVESGTAGHPDVIEQQGHSGVFPIADYKNIHMEGGNAIGAFGDMNHSDRARELYHVQESFDKTKEKIKITKEAIEIFTGKPPRNAEHINYVKEILETYAHNSVERTPSIERQTEEFPEQVFQPVIPANIRLSKAMDLVQNSPKGDKHPDKCTEDLSEEVEPLPSPEVTHSTSHLPNPELQPFSVPPENLEEGQLSRRFGGITMENADPTQSTPLFSTMQKMPQSVVNQAVVNQAVACPEEGNGITQ